MGLPKLSDADLRHYLGEIQGTSKVLLDNAALMAFAIPPLRSDLELIYDYALEPGPILDIPIEVIGGVDDKWAPLEALLGWRSLTNAAFRLRMIAGGHFAATSSPELILETMETHLRAMPNVEILKQPPSPRSSHEFVSGE